MPLLLCPNDNGPMQTVQRSGVEFDMCPTCRGVWFDRGELEKLMLEARGSSAPDQSTGAPPPQAGFLPQPQSRPASRRDWDDDDDHRYKKKRSSIFDIFD